LVGDNLIGGVGEESEKKGEKKEMRVGFFQLNDFINQMSKSNVIAGEVGVEEEKKH